MPQEEIRVLTIGKNYFSKEVSIVSAKQLAVTYTNKAGAAITFAQKPDVNVLMLTAGVQNPVKIRDIKTSGVFSGAVLGFNSITTALMKVEYKEAL